MPEPELDLLDRVAVANALPCGCRAELIHTQEGPTNIYTPRIAFCPLHAAAEAMRAALEKIAELEGDCEQQKFKLTRFQASQIARAALLLVPEKGAKTE